jgi:hypothetical protein
MREQRFRVMLDLCLKLPNQAGQEQSPPPWPLPPPNSSARSCRSDRRWCSELPIESSV